MAIIKTGTFTVTSGGTAQNLALGFTPDVLTLWNDTKLASGTGVAYAQWLSSMANASAYIQTLTGGAPVWTKLTTNGVTPYSTSDSALFAGSSPVTAGTTNLTITGISKAANASITATHNFTSADVGVTTVSFHGISGMTQMNTLTGVIQTVTGTTSFTVNINSTNFTTYTSGGIANIVTGNPASTTTGFQVYNTPLLNIGTSGVTLGTSLMVTTADTFRYEAVLNTPVNS